MPTSLHIIAASNVNSMYSPEIYKTSLLQTSALNTDSVLSSGHNAKT